MRLYLAYLESGSGLRISRLYNVRNTKAPNTTGTSYESHLENTFLPPYSIGTLASFCLCKSLQFSQTRLSCTAPEQMASEGGHRRQLQPQQASTTENLQGGTWRARWMPLCVRRRQSRVQPRSPPSCGQWGDIPVISLSSLRCYVACFTWAARPPSFLHRPHAWAILHTSDTHVLAR